MEDKLILLAQDYGYGVDKIAYRDKNGKIKWNKFNSAVAEAPINTDDMPLFEGRRYYIGDIALMEESQNIKDLNDYAEHEKFAPLSLWNCIDMAGLDKDKIGALVVGLSLAQSSHASRFVKRISNFKVNEHKFDFKDKIVLIPQGIGAKYAIDHFYYKDAPDSEKNYSIIDLGQLTLDAATVFGGKARSEGASGTADTGVIWITNKLKGYISSDPKFKTVLSMRELQKIIINKTYTFYGETYDLSKQIDQYKKEYTEFLASFLLERYRNIFQKSPKIFIIGGGQYYLDMDVLKNTPGIPFKSFVFPKNPEYLNAIGNLIGGELAIQQGVLHDLKISSFRQELKDEKISNNSSEN